MNRVIAFVNGRIRMNTNYRRTLRRWPLVGRVDAVAWMWNGERLKIGHAGRVLGTRAAADARRAA